MKLLLHILLLVCVVSADAQTSFVYESDDYIPPSFFNLKKDSAIVKSFFASFAGIGDNVSGMTKSLSRDSLNFLGWLNTAYYRRNLQVNLKLHYQHNSIDSLGKGKDLAGSEEFRPKIQVGVYPNDEQGNGIDGNLRLQLSWSPVIRTKQKTSNEFELDYGGKIVNLGDNFFDVCQFYFLDRPDLHSYSYGISSYSSLVDFPNSKVIAGVDWQLGYSRSKWHGNDKSENFNVGLVTRLLGANVKSTVFLFINYSNDYWSGHRYYSLGLFFLLPVIHKIGYRPAPRIANSTSLIR